MHSGKRELVNIQLLRAVAALLVIFVHFDTLLPVAGLAPFGGGGVDLFFVISGFIMVYTTRDRNAGALAFLRDRVTRIVPIYWLLTFTVVLAALIAPQVLKSTSGNIVELVKSLLFIPFRKASGQIEPTLFVGWTLNYEMFFYVIFCAGLLIRPYDRGLAFTLSVLVGLVLAGMAVPALTPVAAFYTNPMMLEFALGIVIAIFFHRLAPVFAGRRWAVVLACVIPLCVAVLAMVDIIQPVLKDLTTIAIGASAAIAVFAALMLEENGHKTTSTLVIAIGDASYSLYLIHPFVTQSFQKIGKAIHANGPISLVLVVAGLVTAVGLALVVHRFVEKPMTWAARELLKPARRQVI